MLISFTAYFVAIAKIFCRVLQKNDTNTHTHNDGADASVVVPVALNKFAHQYTLAATCKIALLTH